MAGADGFILFAAAAGGYLAGSIPFGLILTRLAGGGDIRRIGSGNIGATNVLRSGRKGLAAVTLLLDGGKGAAAVLVARGCSPDAALLAAGFAVIGHSFPVWLGFRGGKGVATTFGVLLALSWPVGVAALAVWLGTALLTGYSSLAALVAIGSSPLLAWMLADQPTMFLAGALAPLVVWRHRANIARLIAGTESRITLRRG